MRQLELDERVRRELARIMDKAPLGPEFGEISISLRPAVTERRESLWSRRGWAAAVAAFVVATVAVGAPMILSDPAEDIGTDSQTLGGSLSRASSTDSDPAGASECEPPSPFVGAEGQAVGNGISAWLMLLSPVPPDEITVGTEVKVVWRATGQGSPTITIRNLDTTKSLDAEGLRHHTGGSNWDRPGDEFHHFVTFQQVGCHELTLSRDSGHSASFWLLVKE